MIGPGSVVWADLDPTRGREQAGRRPAAVVSTTNYLNAVPSLIIVVSITTHDRGSPHHVRLTGEGLGLDRVSYAMTEQLARSLANGSLSLPE